ncbi:MAG: alpha/beta hydrolase, partial [Variovorax sp.]
SREVRQVGLALTRRVTKGRISIIEGGHLFPMEHPIATAAAIEAAVRDMTI